MKNASVTVVALALALAACNKGPEQESAPAGSSAVAAPAGGAARGSDAVPAVVLSEGTPVAKLQFVLESRPVVGKAFPLQLQVSAAEPLPQLQLAAESTDLIVAPAGATLELAEANVTVTHDLLVTAPKEGLFDLQVRLKSGDAPETVYAVPVMVTGAAAAQ